jgi:hypothetical protein
MLDIALAKAATADLKAALRKHTPEMIKKLVRRQQTTAEQGSELPRFELSRNELLPDRFRHRLQSIANAELALHLLEVGANGLFADPQDLCDLAELCPRGHYPQHSKRSRGHLDPLSHPSGVMVYQLLQAQSCKAGRSEENDPGGLGQDLAQGLGGPVGHQPSASDGASQGVAHAVL